MASFMRIIRPIGSAAVVTVPRRCSSNCRSLSTTTSLACYSRKPTVTQSLLRPIASFHTTVHRGNSNNNEPPPTDFAAMDVLGNTPVPSTSVDVLLPDGFKLNSGARIEGAGAIIVSGEAFEWRPWLVRGEHRLLNTKGQWEVPNESLGPLSVLWPRPDLLILGLGPEIRPISPELRRFISSLGMRVEILDTRNAADEFNLLVRERGINDIAAALIPIGWKEGIGAK